MYVYIENYQVSRTPLHHNHFTHSAIVWNVCSQLVCMYQTCFTCTLTTVLIHWLSLLYRQSKIQNGGLKSRLHTITITIYGTLTWKTACDREDVALASVGCCVLFLLPISSMLRISLAVLGWERKEGCIVNTLVSFSGHQTVLLKKSFLRIVSHPV